MAVKATGAGRQRGRRPCEIEALRSVLILIRTIMGV